MQFKVVILMLAVATGLATSSPILTTKFVEQFNLDASVQTLFPTVNDLDQRLEQISKCYDPELVGQTVDLFNRSTSIKSIVDQYYNAFPHKTITAESIRQLIASINQITSACLQSELDTVQYGFTELSDMTDAEIRGLTGIENPSFNSSIGTEPGLTFLSGGDAACKKSGKVLPDSYDWRHHGGVTPVRNQGGCGSCWIFGAVASIESAYLIHKKTHDKNFALSEQQVVDCAKANGCKGGTSMTAFSYIKSHGITSSKSYPYKAKDNHCTNHKYAAAAKIKDFCIRSKYRYTSNFHSETLTDHSIIQAIVNYGPVYILLDANPAWTRNYKGGIAHGPCTTKINHAVLAVGYTHKSWIIKNSWGASWGKGGYFELARDHNVCGVNTEIAFPLL